MSVNVLLFAALRDAAGERRTTSEAPTVGALKEELVGRYGDRFARYLELSKVVVDGDQVGDETSLSDASEVALLPPFSGG